MVVALDGPLRVLTRSGPPSAARRRGEVGRECRRCRQRQRPHPAVRVKIGAKVVAHGRYLVFQMAEVALPRALFRSILDRIAGLRPPDPALC